MALMLLEMLSASGPLHALSTPKLTIPDPVLQAIHDRDATEVRKHIRAGYDIHQSRWRGHSAVSYGALRRRLHILQEMLVGSDDVTLHALRSARAPCPIDVVWEFVERGEKPPSTFNYSFGALATTRDGFRFSDVYSRASCAPVATEEARNGVAAQLLPGFRTGQSDIPGLEGE